MTKQHNKDKLWVKAKIDKMQKNNQCRSYGDIISKCSKL